MQDDAVLDPEPQPEPQHPSLPETMADVFDRWFEGFNDAKPDAKAVPHPGFISLRAALRLIRDAGLAPWPMEALRLVARTQCVTRHMHARPTELAHFWVDEGMVFDNEKHRVRRSSDPDQPPNWFAVQVYEDGLREVIAATLAAQRARAQEQTDDDGPTGDGADDMARAAAAMGLPADAQRRGLEAVVPHLNRAYDRAVELGAASLGEQLTQPRPPLDRPAIPADAEVAALQTAMPPGYELRVTPHGFVVVWRSPPQGTAAEAVRVAWAHTVTAEILRK